MDGALRRLGISRARCRQWVAAVTELPQSQAPLVELRRRLTGEGEAEAGALEQLLLVDAALHALDALPRLPVPESVKGLFHQAFRFFATADPRLRGSFEVGSAGFASMCKVATMRRFPAGQFEWEVSGIPRSLLVRVPPRALPRVLWTIARELGGRAPLLFPHFAACGGRRLTIPEAEVKRALYRMARALELQPQVRGMTAASWFFSPDTYRVSPHLAWLAELFRSGGGVVTTAGAAGPDSGVLAGSAERRRLYESGEFRPTLGLVIWPRAAMLAWADRSPELED